MTNYYAIHEDDVKAIVLLLESGHWATITGSRAALDLADSLNQAIEKLKLGLDMS